MSSDQLKGDRLPRRHLQNMTRSTLSKSYSSKGGYSLVELLVATSVLSIVGLSSITGLLQGRRLTESSLYLNTATTVAQGYMEQIKNMEFDSLNLNVLPTLINQGATDQLLVSPSVADPEIGSSETDVPNLKSIDIQNTPNTPGDDLKMSIFVYVDDTSNPGGGIGESKKITLRYEYPIHGSDDSVLYSNTLYGVRSRVPTF